MEIAFCLVVDMILFFFNRTCMLHVSWGRCRELGPEYVHGILRQYVPDYRNDMCVEDMNDLLGMGRTGIFVSSEITGRIIVSIFIVVTLVCYCVTVAILRMSKCTRHLTRNCDWTHFYVASGNTK